MVTMAKKLEDVFKSKMARMPKDTPQPPAAAKSSGAQGAGAAGRLQQVKEAEAEDSDDTSSDWNKRLLQVHLSQLIKPC